MDIKRTTNWGMVIGGAILLAIGIFCMVYPGLTLSILSVVAGLGFLIVGIANLAAYITSRTVLKTSVWALAYSILDILVGLLFILYPVALAPVIPFICGVGVLIFAIAELAGAFRVHAMGVSFWGWTLFSGIISAIIGVLFFVYPASLALYIGLFAAMQGISVLVYGIAVGKVELF